MSVIFPGNFVAHLNAYRGQGVLSIPGVELYRYVGVAVIDEDTAAGALDLAILSPDLRPDDKPRLDKPFVIPEGASIYRTAVGVYGLSGADGETVTVTGVAGGAVLTADAEGVYPAEGAVTPFEGFGSLTPLGADTTITATTDGELIVVNEGSAATGSSQSAVIVEVDFFMDAPAPDRDDVHLPFKVVSGQGT